MFRYLTFLVLFLVGCSAPVECLNDACSQEDTDMNAPMLHNIPATPVVIVPNRENGWGQGFELTPQSQQQSHFQKAFGKHGNYTVQFKVIDPNSLSGGTLTLGDRIRAKAALTWSVNGNPLQRIVDVADGVSITGVAEAVDVILTDNSRVTGLVPPINLPYKVIVSVAEGTRPAVEQPPTLSLIDGQIFAAGTTTQISLPKEAGIISVNVAIAPFAAGGTIGAYQVLVHQCQNSVKIKSYDPRQSDWVPLVAGATDLRIETDAALTTSVVAQITLGIDG